MTTEWKDLPTLQDVAKAQADGWEIEHYNHPGDCWNVWPQRGWNIQGKYRARPGQPKMKKVKSLCWIHKHTGAVFYGFMINTANDGWIRQPHLDLEGEVPE